MVFYLLIFFVWDVQVLNEANLTNAILSRTVLTRSDLGGAVIEGADFSDAVLDLPQKLVQYDRRFYGTIIDLFVQLMFDRMCFSVVKMISWRRKEFIERES